MVKITNGTIVCEVTRGAFDGIYSRQGFRVIEEPKVEATPAAVTQPENEFEALEEKPLSQWNKTEVKEYAAAHEIDLAGTKNVNEAKERIMAYLDSVPEA